MNNYKKIFNYIISLSEKKETVAKLYSLVTAINDNYIPSHLFILIIMSLDISIISDVVIQIDLNLLIK